MELIQTITVGAGGASFIQFASVPQDSTDLKLVVSARSSNADSSFSIRLNGSTTNLLMRFLSGYGNSRGSSTSTSQVGNMTGSDYTANTFGNTELYLCNYTSGQNKTFNSTDVTENNAILGVQNIVTGVWSNTAAVTSIGFWGNFAQHSTASLYKITKA